MIQRYQIIKKRLPKHFNTYLVGVLIKPNLYIYQINNLNKDCLFRGKLQEVVEKLLDEGFLKYAEREIAKNGKLVRVENRVRCGWKQKRGIGRLIG